MRSHEKWPVNGAAVDTVACWGRMSAECASQLVKCAVGRYSRNRPYVVAERQTTQTESDNKTVSDPLLPHSFVEE